MRKCFILLLLCFLLSACVDSSYSFTKELDKHFDNIDTLASYRINNVMDYFSYYLPKDMQEETLDSNSVLLRFNNSHIIMNINIPNIINTKYYVDNSFYDEKLYDSNKEIAHYEGTYKDFDKNLRLYRFGLFQYDDKYMLHLMTSEMNYYGNVAYEDISDVVYHLLTIMKNTIVNHDMIIADFSSKDVIDYHKKQINLFDKTMPESGELLSMLTDDAKIGEDE